MHVSLHFIGQFNWQTCIVICHWTDRRVKDFTVCACDTSISLILLETLQLYMIHADDLFDGHRMLIASDMESWQGSPLSCVNEVGAGLTGHT